MAEQRLCGDWVLRPPGENRYLQNVSGRRLEKPSQDTKRDNLELSTRLTEDGRF